MSGWKLKVVSVLFVSGWSGGGSMTATTPGTSTGTSWTTAGAAAGSRTPGWSSGM